MFRYALFSGLANKLIYQPPIEVAENQSIHFVLDRTVMNRMITEKIMLYWWFPPSLFVSTAQTRRQNIYGWVLSLLFASLLTSVLLWLLW